MSAGVGGGGGGGGGQSMDFFCLASPVHLAEPCASSDPELDNVTDPLYPLGQGEPSALTPDLDNEKGVLNPLGEEQPVPSVASAIRSVPIVASTSQIPSLLATDPLTPLGQGKPVPSVASAIRSVPIVASTSQNSLRERGGGGPGRPRKRGRPSMKNAASRGVDDRLGALDEGRQLSKELKRMQWSSGQQIHRQLNPEIQGEAVSEQTSQGEPSTKVARVTHQLEMEETNDPAVHGDVVGSLPQKLVQSYKKSLAEESMKAMKVSSKGKSANGKPPKLSGTQRLKLGKRYKISQILQMEAEAAVYQSACKQRKAVLKRATKARKRYERLHQVNSTTSAFTFKKGCKAKGDTRVIQVLRLSHLKKVEKTAQSAFTEAQKKLRQTTAKVKVARISQVLHKDDPTANAIRRRRYRDKLKLNPVFLESERVRLRLHRKRARLDVKKSITSRLWRYSTQPGLAARGKMMQRAQQRARLAYQVFEKEEDHLHEYWRQAGAYRKALQRNGGVFGWRQPGSRPDRVKRQEAFIDTITDRITRVTQSSHAFRSSENKPRGVVVDMNEELERATRREVYVCVKQAARLKHDEVMAFFHAFNRICAIVTLVRQNQEHLGIEVAVNGALRPPPAAVHSQYRKPLNETWPVDKYKKIDPLSKKEVPVHCTEDCEASLPSHWQEKLWTLLSDIRCHKWDISHCIEDLLEFEHCDGCVEFTNVCRNELSGKFCRDGIKLLRKILPHSQSVSQFLMNGIYPARRAVKSIMELEEVLHSPSTSLLRLQTCVEHVTAQDQSVLSKVRKETKAPSGPRPSTKEADILEKWGDSLEEFKRIEKDHPIHLCGLCNEERRKDQMMATPITLETFRGDKLKKTVTSTQLWQILQNCFPDVPPMQLATKLPVKVCSDCWNEFREGKTAKGMIANAMGVDKLPVELRDLNMYEQFLIARVHTFYTMVKLRPLGKHKVPERQLLSGTKGSAIHLPLPTAPTAKKVLDTLPMKDPQSVLQIYADVPSKASGVTWRNFVDVEKVLKALQWLKANNVLYQDVEIRPEVFDQMGQRGFVQLTGDNEPHRVDDRIDCEAPDDPRVAELADKVGEQSGILYPRADQHILTGAYSVQPTNSAKVAHGKDLETYVQVRVEGDPLPSQTVNMDALSNPLVYPKGRGNLDDDTRPCRLSPAAYIHHRLRNADSRFRHNLKLLHQWYFQKRDRAINQGCYASTKTGTTFGKLTAGEIVKRIENKDVQLENDLSMLMQAVKNSKEYWNRQASDLACMDDQCGPATFFVTLSCAEYKWEEMENYLRLKNASLTNINRAKVSELLAADPVLVSEFFFRRFKAFFDKVIRPVVNSEPQEGPLGVVEHYYWRLEYQARGAPHIHMKLWIRDAPVLGINSPEEVAAFISKYISCEIPRAEDNPDLKRLVENFQRHRCTKSCLKYSSKRKMKCRYGFPRAASDVCEVLDAKSVLKGVTRRHNAKRLCQLPRSEEEKYINDFNPTLLYMWRANMDIQFVGETSRILNGYITSYVTKAEKNETEHIWQCLSADKSANSALKSLAHSTFRDREIGSYEIADDLLGNNLHGSSIAVKWLGLGFPEDRKRKALSFNELKALPANSTRTSATNVIDDYYPDRSEDLEDVSLHDIIAQYEWKRGKDHGSAMRPFYPNKEIEGGFLKRHKCVLVKTPFVQVKDEMSELLYHNLLQEFVPHRSEFDDLKRGKSTWREAFSDWEQELPMLSEIQAAKRKLQDARDLRRKLEDEAALEEAVEEAVNDLERDAAEEEADDAVPPIPARSGLRDQKGFATPEGMAERADKLNAKQRTVFDEVTDNLKHWFLHKESKCSCGKTPSQILKFISGGAGVGKSKLIQALAEAAEVITGQPAILAAPTGLAAQNIDGKTIHSLFKLGVQDPGKDWVYDELQKEAMKSFGASIHSCPLIIIDEISMVSNTMLYFIHQRLRDLMQSPESLPFGGFNVIVLGDLLQLPPVNARFCFEPLSKTEIRKAFPGSRAVNTPVKLWDHFSYALLTENMRQNNDKAYADCLNQLRLQEVEAASKILESRKVDCGSSGEEIAKLCRKLRAEGENPVCLFARSEKVNQVNVATLLAENIKPEFLFAQDRTMKVKKRKSRKKPPANASYEETLKYLNENTEQKANKTGGLDETLVLGVGARVMLKQNLDLEGGLYNGAMGTITGFVRSNRQAHEVVAVDVQFDNGRRESLERAQTHFKIAKAIDMVREQFPLCLAYAMTIHKSQGLSLDCVVTNLGTDIFQEGMAYVCLSRVKTLAGLYLYDFNPNFVWANAKCVAEYERLRKLFEPSLPPMKMGTSVGRRPFVGKTTITGGQGSNASKPVAAKATAAKKTAPKQSTRAPRALNIQHRFVGLKRDGGQFRNRCFCNTATQVLLASEPIRAILADPQHSDAAIDALRPLFQAERVQDHVDRDTDDVLDVGNNAAVADNYVYQTFKDGEQQDSLDFLYYLIEASPTLTDLFRVNIDHYFRCTKCGFEDPQPNTVASTFHTLRRPVDPNSTEKFLDALHTGTGTPKRCSRCNPDQEQGDGEFHDERVVLRLAQNTRHLLLKIPLHSVAFHGGVPVHHYCRGKLTGFKSRDYIIDGVKFHTSALAVKTGESASSGHYFALTKAEKGWSVKDDTALSERAQLPSHLSQVYYVLLTRTQ